MVDSISLAEVMETDAYIFASQEKGRQEEASKQGKDISPKVKK